jgi:hypothetical protein
VVQNLRGAQRNEHLQYEEFVHYRAAAGDIWAQARVMIRMRRCWRQHSLQAAGD